MTSSRYPDIPVIRSYFNAETVRGERAEVGLSDPTDVELEYISQARSDHCNHNTFQGLFRYKNLKTGRTETIDNLFKTCIQQPTLALKEKKAWVISVLWDNAGAGRFDADNYYVITGETHNSPSNMEAYGGAITGIVGVYRDPLGTGKGSRLLMGGYGYCGDYPVEQYMRDVKITSIYEGTNGIQAMEGDGGNLAVATGKTSQQQARMTALSQSSFSSRRRMAAKPARENQVNSGGALTESKGPRRMTFP